MLYVKAAGNVIVAYPYTQTDLIRDNPGTSFPAGALSVSTLAEWNVFPVHFSPCPEINPAIEKVAEASPIFDGASWQQQWAVTPLTQEEIDANILSKANAVRAERNAKLIASDWTQVADAPVDQNAWAVYRQELRDIPNQAGFPLQVVWPNPPA